jgi:hypothetical protein
MEVIKLIAEIDNTGKLKIDLPTNLEAGEVDLVVIVNPLLKKDKRQNIYDFSNLPGELSWRGDAVTIQRKLRDEW